MEKGRKYKKRPVVTKERPESKLTLPETWEDIFGEFSSRPYPKQKNIFERIEEFGQTYGKIKAEIVRHRLLNMNTAADSLTTQLQNLEKEFDEKIYDYIGYPKLKERAKEILEEKARAEGKFLNQYSYASYPKPIPSVVQQAIQKAKTFFPDYNIKIWAIENSPIKDPAVIGEVYLNGTVARYLIALWDKDILLDDIVDLKKFNFNQEL